MSFEVARLLEFSQAVGKGTEQGHLCASGPRSLLKTFFDWDAELLEIVVKFLAIGSTFGRCSASGRWSHLLNQKKRTHWLASSHCSRYYVGCWFIRFNSYELIILPGCRLWSLSESWAFSRPSSRRQMAVTLASLTQGLSCWNCLGCLPL